MSRNRADSTVGGSLVMPEGHFVERVDLDAEEPYCMIVHKDDVVGEEAKILIPRSLAYYLSTHHNGSNEFRDLLRRDAKNELRAELQSLLKMEYK